MSYRFLRSGLLHASLFALAAGLASVPAPADDAPAFADLPPFLLERMNRSATIDEYVSNLVREAKRGDIDGNGLDRQDIDTSRQMEAVQYRAMMLQQIASNDLDGNGEVTRDEATRALTFRTRMQGGDDSNQVAQQKRIAQEVDRAMKLDGNGDGAVTLQEAMQAEWPEQTYRRDRYGQYETLLELDPNKDGRLTMEELDQVARAAFQQADYDHDGTLSPAEIKLLEPARRWQRELKSALPCDLPRPAAEELVTVLGIYDGVLQPKVSVVGQDEQTQLTLVDVEPGDQPIYLMLTSYQAMIWQFRGATDRIAKVVVVRAYVSGQIADLAGAGVVGIAKDKVTFLPYGSCGHAFNNVKAREAEIMSRMVARVTGRAPDALLGVYSAKMIGVPSGTAQGKSGDKDLIIPGDGNDVVILGGNRSNVQVIEGPEAMALSKQEDWLAPAGNLTMIEASDVLAPGKVEPYDVLPNQFGLRQLVQDGKLERTAKGYRIVQPIARFPAGLGGSHGVTFLLPEGTPMPAGNPSHAQIVLEKKSAE
jgi:hypothetical protein